MYEIPEKYLEPTARLAFEGKLPGAKIDPRLVRWFNDSTCGESALLIGTTDCGKTLSAAMVASVARHWSIEIPGQKFRVRVSKTQPTGGKLRTNTVVRWIRADRLSMLGNDRNSAQDIDLMISAPLLVIDELGYERFSETVLMVIGTRESEGRPTIVTSGKTYIELASRYSEATITRLTRRTGGVLVDCHRPTSLKSVAVSWPAMPALARPNGSPAPGGRPGTEDAPIANPEAMAKVIKLLQNL